MPVARLTSFPSASRAFPAGSLISIRISPVLAWPAAEITEARKITSSDRAFQRKFVIRRFGSLYFQDAWITLALSGSIYKIPSRNVLFSLFLSEQNHHRRNIHIEVCESLLV